MSKKLKQHLIDMSENDSRLKILCSHLDFDEELIPKALQNIVTIFPHYSRHDISHSHQILVNIERLLGDSIEMLSATDTWLIIEAAYWHDIGMVVTSDEISKAVESEDFENYLQSISANPTNEQKEFAKKLLSCTTPYCYKGDNGLNKVYDDFRVILAEWFRGQHSKRAEQIVNNPFELLGVSSPRNELLPARLFEIIGKICLSHGMNFDEILELLPFSEVGVGLDDCHPRFVAFLLRMGDLLDIDNNRFCPVMLRMISSIPQTSITHKKKHLAIKHFRFDKDRIEISAVCDDYDDYEITDRWFSWIKTEASMQMSKWSEIVPSRDFGLLPTIGSLDVSLKSNKEVLQSGSTPRFSIDTHQAINLLQGSGLYSDKWQSIRELLQNAVDSTLQKIWLTNLDKGLEWDITSEEIQKIFNSYQIEISLDKIKDLDDDTSEWKISIKDRGIGISRNDLRYMQTIGSSYKNQQKQSVIKKMPTWMQPSGRFGIGLQSVFLISDEIVFDSKSIMESDGLKITMKSPLREHGGIINIEKNDKAAWSEAGSILSFAFKINNKHEYLGFKTGQNITRDYLCKIDPIVNNSIPYEILTILDEIASFKQNSLIAIKIESELFSDETEDKQCLTGEYFDKKNMISIVDIDISGKYTRYAYLDDIKVLFKGQLVEYARIDLPFIRCTFNILSGDASEILTVNRNGLRGEKRDEIEETLKDAVVNYLNSESNKFPAEISSAILQLIGKKAKADLVDKWKDWKVSVLGEKSLKEMCKLKKFSIINERQPSINGHEYRFSIYDYSSVLTLLTKLWYENNGYIKLDQKEPKRYSEDILVFSKTPIDPIGENKLIKSLLEIAESQKSVIYQHQQHPYNRLYYPSYGEFKKLTVQQTLMLTDKISNYHEDVFVFPYFFDGKKFVLEHLEELYRWTIDNNLNANKPTLEEVKELYGRFIDSVKDVVEQVNKKI